MDIFRLLNSNFPGNLKRIFLKMQMWTGYIVLPLTERKKCLLRLNVKWQNMISLQGRSRMMQQMLLLPLILPEFLGLLVIRWQTQLLPNKLKDQYCFKTEAAIKCLKFVKGEKIWLK